eukprot:Rmarinus@m.13225
MRILLFIAFLFLTWSAVAFAGDAKLQGKVNALKKWADGAGMKFNGVELSVFDDDHVGFRATEDIKEEKVVLEMPIASLMTLKGATEGKAADVLKEAENLHPSYVLALHLIAHKADALSELRSYIALLPTEFNTPMFWNEDELKELAGTAAMTLSVARKRVLEDDFNNTILPLMKKFPTIYPESSQTLDNFLWAVSVCMSRSLNFAVQNVMVPLVPVVGDFFSHANVDTQFTLDGDAEMLTLTVRSEYAKGDEVYASMGSLSNTELLMNSGVVLDENPFDAVRMSMFMREDDPFYSVKAAILERHGLGRNHMFRFVPTGISVELMRAARIQMMKPSEFDRYHDVFTPRGRLSLETELASYRQIIGAAEALLKSYPTSLQADLAALSESNETPLPERQRLATFLRATEKAILARSIDSLVALWQAILIEGY